MHRNRLPYNIMDERSEFANIRSEIGLDVDRKVRFSYVADWQVTNV